MQTFITDNNCKTIAQTLDYRRLNKQRVECKQIYTAIIDPDYGWQNHPAVNMWRKHRQGLAFYAATMCREWLHRGYNDHVGLYGWFLHKLPPAALDMKTLAGKWPTMPDWWGDERIIASHRANLVRKDPDYYSAFWPEYAPDNDIAYVWPVDLAIERLEKLHRQVREARS